MILGRMHIDVFISYSHRDKLAADAACNVLERNGIRCWIAPRDVDLGRPWATSILAAINEARLLVLVFSGNANESQQVVREVERAIAKGIPVIPVRIEDVKPTESLEYFLSTPHWLDAFDPPLEEHLEELALKIRKLIVVEDPPGQNRSTSHTGKARTTKTTPTPRPTALTGWKVYAAAGLLVAALAAGYVTLRQTASSDADASAHCDAPANSPETAESRVSSFTYPSNGQKPVPSFFKRLSTASFEEEEGSNVSHFAVLRRAHYAVCDGDVVESREDPSLQLFITDKNCQISQIYFRRRPSCQWYGLSSIVDIN
jgi:hypothetical protein